VDQRVRLEWRKPSIGEEALPGRGPRGFIRFPSLYREAWARARDKRPHHRALSDEFLWHDVYNFYVENSPLLALCYEPDPLEEIELPDKPVTRKRARPLTLGQSPRMADGG